MDTRAPTALVDERDLYPIHEEDDVGEIPFHERQTRYLRDALSTRYRDRFVSGNVCIYWERGKMSLYRAPDVFVAAGMPVHPEPRVYLIWQDPPVLFAAEIGSRSTLREDEGPKVEIYGEKIRARWNTPFDAKTASNGGPFPSREYLYSNPPVGDLRMWRLGAKAYEVRPEANGRLRSRELDLEFGIEDGFLRIHTLDGERLRTHEESEQELEEAEARLAEERARREDLERRLAEMEAKLQPRRRRRTD